MTRKIREYKKKNPNKIIIIRSKDIYADTSGRPYGYIILKTVFKDWSRYSGSYPQGVHICTDEKSMVRPTYVNDTGRN